MLTLSRSQYSSDSSDTNMASSSLNKVPPVIPMGAPLQAATLQPQHFFIAPNYALAANATPDTLSQGGIGITGTPWPAHAASLRPTSTGIPCYNAAPTPTDVFFNGQCILPINSNATNEGSSSLRADKPLSGSPSASIASTSVPAATGNGLVLLDSPSSSHNKPSNKRHRNKSLLLDSEDASPVKVKKESSEPLCTIRSSSTDGVAATSSESKDTDKISYPVSALIDLPGSLTRGSRTSSLSSSLSTVRFGGSLSQLWAASLSSLSGKLNNMKSTGNINADASLPSLGNQYFAFGGSLPELSLTSLSRLLPNSSSNNGTTSTSITAVPSSTNLLTVLQPPLYVYPSQPHLATPFINANGSITFGSFLSTGSSLCSTQKPDSPPPAGNIKSEDTAPCSSTISVEQNALTSSSIATSCDSNNAPGSLNTLAYVASTQKNLVTKQHQYITQDQGSSPSGTGMSPEEPVNGLEGLQECGQSVGLSPLSNDHRIKMEDDDDCQSVGSYSEVKPYFMMMSPLNQSNVTCKKDNKEKPYKCDYPGCGRCFSFPAHLKSHVQQIHISYRPCKCDFPGCGKRFYTPQHLNVHRRIHTGERPFVCPYTDCNKAFTTAGNLKNHIRTHTGERPYACKFEGCTKRFAEMSSLKKHELTHTGEKPYKCRVCGKAFSQAGSRNTHERKHNRAESDAKISRRYRIKRVANEEEGINNGSPIINNGDIDT